MWEKIKDWLQTEDSCWFFIGFFLHDFFYEMVQGNNMSAAVALAIVLGNTWLLRNK